MTPRQIIAQHWREIASLVGILCTGFITFTAALVAIGG